MGLQVDCCCCSHQVELGWEIQKILTSLRTQMQPPLKSRAHTVVSLKEGFTQDADAIFHFNDMSLLLWLPSIYGMALALFTG